MYRSKFTVTALAITFFLFFVTNVFGDITKDGKVVPITDTTTTSLSTEFDNCPNYPPAFDLPTKESFYICEGSTIYDTIIVTDPDTWQTLSISLYSGPGNFSSTPSVSPVMGYYEYIPTEEGLYEVVYVATDGAYEPIYFTKTYVIYFDHSPIITNGGIIEQVAVIGEELSYDVDATDAEDDPFTFSLISGDGTIDSNSGMLTFTPLDYGIYEFEVEVSDSCGADISLITFDIILGFILECPPENATEFICQPDTLCYPIGGIPEEADVTVEPSSAWFDWDNNSVCFYTNCSVVKDIKIIVSTENSRCDDCPPVDLDSCMFTVDVTLNSNPVVMLPEDQSFWICDQPEICIPTGINDVDNNITDISVEILPGGQIGSYSEISGNACFTPTVSGNYKMIVSARDECEAYDIDTINLDVTVNSAPTATCSPIQELLVCDLSPVTLSGFICDDFDDNLVSCEVDNGTLANGDVTFTPVEGENIISLTATDECGEVTTCQTIVTVTVNSSPTATCPSIQELLVCDLSPVTLNGFICDDLDGNLANCDVDNGVINGEEVTFTPVEGENIIILMATDECGLVATCQTIINVTLNSAPSVICPADQELFVCDLSPITIYGFICDDIDGNLVSCETDNGTLYYNDLTFTPVEGENVIILTATDECGVETTCQTIITVSVNSTPVATCPGDQEMFVCDLSEITISGFNCADIDGNIYSCEVDNGVLDGSNVRFTPVEGENVIKLTAIDDCNEVSICQTTITVTLNSPPTATCPPVSNFTVCDLAPITLGGFICDDIDGNITSCEVDNGSLNGNDLTFTPVEGENIITLTVTDACGETAICQTTITATVNSAPTVSVPVSQDMFVCDLTPITIGGFICDDVDGNLFSCDVDNGILNGTDVTFTPVIGTNTIILTATDDCGFTATGQVNVNITLNSSPTATCPGDQELFLCDLSPVTLSGFVCDDIDGNLASCETDNGTLYYNDLTFTPVIGENIIILTATDECGAVTTCQTVITVILNTSPTATCPGDQELFVCDLSEICITGFMCDDIDGNLVNCDVTGGDFTDGSGRSSVFKDGTAVAIENIFDINETDINNAMATSGRTVCFIPVEGTNVITLTAIDDCGEEISCQTTITVTLNSPPTASVPEPSELFVCDLSDITISGFICEDIDGNIISCEVDNGIKNGNEVTFTPTSGLNTITLTATDECGVVTTNQTTVMVNLNSAPTVTCPEDLQKLVCDLSPISLSGFFCDDIDGNLVICEVDNGTLTGNDVAFTPIEGENIITLTATDECGMVTACQTIVNVTLNSAPTVTCPPDQDLLVCDLSSVTLAGFLYEDVDGNITSAEVDNGTLTGNDVTFMPVIGENIITLTVIDDCGNTAICQTTVNVVLNNPPSATTPENQELYVCTLSPITLDGFVCDDIDGNLVSCEVDNGTLTGNVVVFTPVEGTNSIILTATDECGQIATSETLIDVEVAPTFQLECPGDVTEFICAPDILCYPIGGIPYGATVSVAPSSAWFNAETSEVCFSTNCSVEKDIVVTVETDCFTEVCQFTSSVTMNSDPMVVLPPDESHWLCDPAEICFPVGINDIDYNISEITIDVQPFDPNAPAAVYNEISGKICFTPTTSDQYIIYVTARDDCDSTGTDSIIVDIVINSAPTVSCAQDQQFLVCDLTPIIISGFICDDFDGNLVSCEVDNGILEGNNVTFTPVEGENVITLTATDECGKIASCQTIITVTLNTDPVAICPDEQNLFVCDLSPITISGFLYNDADGNLASSEVDNGILTGSDVTFTPVEGENIITLTVTDECGAVTMCQTIVNVTLNSAPTATCPGNSELFVCDLSPITVAGFGFDDPDGNITNADVDNGTLIEGVVTFNPVEGENIITLTVTDECGETVSCQTTVLVTPNSPPTATCPNGQELFVCDLSAITIGGFLYEDIDGNLTSSVVDNGVLSGSDVTFTPVVGENIITLTVTDECGEVAACQAIVTVSLNNPPTATCPAEETLFVCDLSEITISGFICDDIDGNLATCDVDNGILIGNEVTFIPIVGANIITLTATDECGETDIRQTIISISLNNPPTASSPPEQNLFLCELLPISIPGFICDDIDGNLVSCEVDNGTLNGNEVTFTPIEGVNTITLTAIDECGETATSQTTITVSLNSPPTVTCAPNQQMMVCDLSEITISGFICDDIDGNLISCEADNGILTGNDVAFTPVEGDNIITLTATDECGETATCQTVITVTLNSAPTATCPGDETIFVCDLNPITIPGFICDDIDGNLISCEIDNGILNGNEVTFTPIEGENIFTLTATDECGEIRTCQTVITVALNNAPIATCLENQEVFVCDLSPITIPGFYCDDFDGNLATCDVDNGTLNSGEVTFTPIVGINTITLIATDECGEVATCQTTVMVNLNTAPTVTCPGDIMNMFVCDFSPITVSGFFCDDIDGNLVSCEVDNGIKNGNEVTFTPIEGENVITLTAVDECGEEASCQVTITVTLNSQPTVSCPGNQDLFVCDLSPITVTGFGYDDPDGNLTSAVVDNGTLSGNNVTFTPVVGDNIITLTATDECGLTANCQTIITVSINNPPTASTPEDKQSTVCNLSPITIDGFICDDIDYNLVSCNVNYGSLNGSELTFTPVEGLNTIILTATDECGETATSEFNITIEVTPEFDLTCPQSSTIFLCEPTSLEYPISGIPEDATVTVVPSSAWYDAQTGMVGFYTNCSVVRDIEVYVETDCQTEVCRFTVTVVMNSTPLVMVVPDTTLTICGNELACIPAGITDIDDNITSITVEDKITGLPIGSYDPVVGGICFMPEASGEYELILKAVDECGAIDADTARVSITVNTSPTATCPGDMELFVCDLSPISLSGFFCDDIDGNLVTCEVDNGTLTGNDVVFTPVEGVNTIILMAIDGCDDTVTCVSNITVTLNTPPTTITPEDSEMFVCDLSEICLNGFICDDVDGNITSCEVNNGVINGNIVCFTPVEGVNTIALTATDECGKTSTSETNITITLNSPPTVICVESYDVFVCELSDITLTGFGCDDVDGNLINCDVDNGILNGNDVIFTPVSGVNEITLTATDECGATTSCVTTVTVTLNSPPTITAPENQDIFICDYSEVCLDGFSCDDIDDNIVFCEMTGAVLEGTTACFTPVLGENIISITTTDECGETGSRDIIFNVIMSVSPEIVNPGNQTKLLCEAGLVCTDITITPPEAVVTVTAQLGELTITGTYENDQVCFQADAEGIYTITVNAETPCGTASESYTVDVEFNVAPVINAGADFELFQCEFVEYCFLPDLLEDGNDNIASVEVSHNGFYNETTGEICFLPTGVGEYCLEITVTDECQLTASDIVCITVTTGEAAVIDCPGEVDTLVCDPGEICISIPITPSTAQVTVSQGTYDIEKGELCFEANYPGTYVIDINAEDACGSATCKVTVNVVFGDIATITCPDLPVSASLCEAGTVSIILPIEPDTAHVTITPFGSYNPATDELSFQADTAGIYEFTVTAEAPCGTAVCDFQVNVSIEEAPHIICPDDIVRTVCIADTDSICFPLVITGSPAEVTISPNGKYEDGVVCVPIEGAGTYLIDITATNFCGTFACNDLNIIVYEDLAPTLTVPEDRIIPSCTDVMEEICIDGIYGSDPDSDEFTIRKISGPGTYISAEADSGSVCFTPESNDITYTFEIELTDGCHTVVESFNVTIYPSNVCETCVEVALETDSCYIVGSTVPVNVTVNAIEEIGGFDLLIYYDASVMAFLSIEQGDAISEWEYLTYNQESVTCGGACPTGMVRIIGIADRTIPMTHPPEEQLTPSGTMFIMNMRLSRDQNVGGLFLPMGFYWFDCGDNTFSDPTGNMLYVDGIILDAFGGVIWDEADEDLFPEENRIVSIGAPDSCLAGDKVTPIRCIQFKNGGICVIHPDDIDDRGDLNLNGVCYEIADAVVYTNYFIYGFSAFLINVDGQTAASDINGDGIPLTVADLVYLIRVITGDVLPNQKVAPPGSTVTLMAQIDDNGVAIKGDLTYPSGAGLLVFEYSDAVPEMPTLGSIASDMNLAYSITDSEIRVLIYSFELNKKIEVGQGDLLNLSFSGNGSIRLTEAYFAGYYGERLKTEIVNSLLPDDFVLSQNYPNPFNPSTTINLTVPVACDWEIKIFNTTGQEVRTFGGTTEPGTISVFWDGSNYNGQNVATGIYFYRVTAADFTETRKMILLK